MIPGIPQVAPLTDYMYNKASQARAPLSGTFELTPMCNFACKMCYVRKTAKEVAESPRPMLTMEQWVEIARQARDAGMLYLLLTGGEPLRWTDFWPLYEQLSYMGLLLTINTNGSMIDEAAIERFAKLPPKRINITLYGASDATYEALCGVKGVYQRVVRAIDGLTAAGVLVKLNCSLTPQNAHDLETMVAFAQKRGLVLDVASYMFPPIRRDSLSVGVNERFTPEEAARYRMKIFRLQQGEERYRKYLEHIAAYKAPPIFRDELGQTSADGKIRCRAGNASFWMTWDGWMTPCGMMTRPRIDVQDGNFTQAWQQVIGACEEIKLNGYCSRCEWIVLCHSCAAMALAETDDFQALPQYLCQTAEAMHTIAKAELSQNV